MVNECKKMMREYEYRKKKLAKMEERASINIRVNAWKTVVLIYRQYLIKEVRMKKEKKLHC